MSSLDESTELFIGRALSVQPFHGYGWTKSRAEDQGYSHDAIAAPEPFSVRLARLWSYGGDARRGGVGQVEAPGHPFDGLWVTFSTRHEGRFNFTDKLGVYNVDLSSAEPTEHHKGWPMAPRDQPPSIAYLGWARIAAGLVAGSG